MKKIFFPLLILLAAMSAKAQEQASDDAQTADTSGSLASHYLVFDIGGGLHFHTYKMGDYGSKTPGAGIMARAGYRVFFGEHWGLGTELNLKSYKTTAKLAHIQEIPNAVDEDGDSYLHRTYFDGLKEKQTQISLNIPVGVYYQTPISERWKAVAGLGLFYQIKDIKSKYSTEGSLETRGFYENYNVEMFGMDQHNFYSASGFEGDNTKFSCLGVFAEGNLLYQVSPRIEIDLGIYVSSGFNYQTESNGALLYSPDCMEANAYKNPKYAGVLESDIVKKSQPFAVGMMAGIRLKLGKSAIKDALPDDVDNGNNGADTTGKDNIVADSTVISVADSTKIPANVTNIPADSTNINAPDSTGINQPVKGGNGTSGENGTDGTGENGTDGGNGTSGTGENGESGDNSGKVNRDNYTNIGKVFVDELKKFNKVSINFAFNDVTLKPTPAQEEMFDAVAKFMKEDPEIVLHIVGHTCNIGTLQQNIYVGQKRAEAVKKEMMNRGVPASRITTKSKAYLEPVAPNDSEENRAKNRRIEFSITNN